MSPSISIPRIASSLLLSTCLSTLFAVDSLAQQSTGKISYSIAPSDIARHVAGRWTTLQLTVANNSDADVEETIVARVGKQSTLQFARRAWVPAHSKRRCWLPVLIPDEFDYIDTHIPVVTMRVKEESGVEKFDASKLDLPTDTRGIRKSNEKSHALTLLQSNDGRHSGEQVHNLYQWICKARDLALDSEQDYGAVNISSHFLPSSLNALDTMDQIVIAGDRFLSDSSSIPRIRSWLRSGGRLWVMLDRLDDEAVTKLLGDAVCHTPVDRVQLNNFELNDLVGEIHNPEGRFESWSSERPVNLLRVMVEDAEVQCTIDGWPAAFFKDYGRGKILFTTLGNRGWVDQRSPLLSLHLMVDRFFVARNPIIEHVNQISESLESDIGYQIPSRRHVTAALGIHLLLVASAAVWFARRKSLHAMAFVVPVGAVVASAVLISMGQRQTGAVPSTIAVGQIARVSPQDAEAEVETVAAVYSQIDRPLPIRSSPSARTTLSRQDIQSGVKRLLFDDDGQSHWMFVDQSPGAIRHLQTESTVYLPRRYRVTGTFNETGFEGKLLGLDSKRLEDPIIIAGTAPALALKKTVGKDVIFTGGPDDVLLADNYIDESVLSSQQTRRQELLRRLVPGNATFGRAAQLLVWTDDIESGVEFPDGYQHRGWALVAVPIELQDHAANTSFKLPATFIGVKTFGGSSSVLNVSTGQWLDDMNRHAREHLRFVLPPQLLPCEIDRAQLEIDISAPRRTLTIQGLVDDEFETLYEVDSPTTPQLFTIDRKDALKVRDGELPLMISVSVTDQSGTINVGSGSVKNSQPDRHPWHIKHVRLNLEGTTL